MDRHIFNEKSAIKSKTIKEYLYDGVIPDLIKFKAYYPTESTLHQESIPDRLTRLSVYSKGNSYHILCNDSYDTNRIWMISSEPTIKTSIRKS